MARQVAGREGRDSSPGLVVGFNSNDVRNPAPRSLLL